MPKGHFVRTEAHKKAISKALKGKPKSAEHTRKNSEAHKGQKFSPETIEKFRQRMLISNPMRGKHITEEHRQRLSESKIGKAVHLKKYGVTDEEYAKQISSGNRWCTHEKHFAPSERFPNSQPVCLDCRSEFYRIGDLRRKYGVTHEWYLQKLASQGGGCAICGSTKPNAGNKHFAVDHDHKTGSPRGLLCSRCNTALSLLEEHPEFVANMVSYLARYR